MNTCDRYQELVSAYVDGETNESEAAEMFFHLGACPDCRAFLSSVLHLQSFFMRNDAPPRRRESPSHAGVAPEDPHRSESPSRVSAPSGFLRRGRSAFRDSASSRHAIAAHVPIWKKKFSIPLPAAAAAIVLLLLSGSLFFAQKAHAPAVVTTLQTEYVCIPAMPIVDVVATPLPPQKSN